MGPSYIWWKSVPDAMRYPSRIIAQVMNIGDYEDVQTLIESFGEETLREVVRRAEAGEFNARSWAYWHYRLGLVALDARAPMPPLLTRTNSCRRRESALPCALGAQNGVLHRPACQMA